MTISVSINGRAASVADLERFPLDPSRLLPLCAAVRRRVRDAA